MSEAPKVYKYLIDSPRWTPNPVIQKVECIRETKAFVELIPEHYRVSVTIRKKDRVYNTWQEAHEVLMARAHSNLNNARLEFQRAQGLHGNIVGMRPPADETTTTTTEQPC